MDVKGAKVGDNSDEEFIGKREEVWRRVTGLRKHFGETVLRRLKFSIVDSEPVTSSQVNQ